MKTKVFPIIIAGIAFLLATYCTKEEPVRMPFLSTTTVTEITTTTATSGGTLAFIGKAEIFTNGVCWNTSGNPSWADTKTVDGIGNPQFISTLSGLMAGTTYYVRAYAINSAGTAYGDELTFTTLGSSPAVITQLPTIVSPTIATLNGTVNANELSTVVTFEYGTSTSYGQEVTADQNPVTGNTSTNVSATLTGLTAGIYHFRVKAVNSLGTVYGADLTFYYLINSPTATTQPATNVEPTAATLNGIVNANNLSTLVTFEYGTSTDYGLEVTAEQSPIEGNTDTGVSAIVTGLTAGTNYYYRVKAVNSYTTVYGDNMTFNSVRLPVLITVPASDITATTAISGGNITDDGGAAITDRGVFYSGFSLLPNIIPQRTHDGTGTGSFTSSLTGLRPYTTYHIQAYAVNSRGEGKGDIITFTTLQPPRSCDKVPVASTSAPTNISTTGATLNGTIIANGSSTIATFEYQTRVWSGGRGPGVLVWKTVTATQSPITGTDLTNVSADVAGLKSGTTHPFRVKAVNSCGTVYGETLSFTLQ